MSIAIVWFRHDLRLADNPAFTAACNNHEAVIPLYIYDKETSVLGRAQQWWLHQSLIALNRSLQDYGLNLVLRQGNPDKIINELISRLSVDAIYWNRCYEPMTIARDTDIKSSLQQKGIKANSFNGSLLHEPWTIKNKKDEYFKVFTPYWKHCLQNTTIPPIASLTHRPRHIDVASDDIMSFNLLPVNPDWASQFSQHWQPGEAGAQKKLDEFIEHHLKGYKTNRDIPACNASSRLSPHLHFGEISPWTIWRAVEAEKTDTRCDLPSADHFLSELGWREFSHYLLFHVPTLPADNFRKEFDLFPWHVDEKALRCWQKGITGYPVVDAGMRELWATGYMHNRVRMIVASFLTKDLFIDWRKGAEWFLDTLLDADLANNSASWQWVAGCGADAAPYFRIFNPVVQSQKFDPDGLYIRRWVPELAKVSNLYIHQPWMTNLPATTYPKPIVDHNEMRQKALDYYKTLKNNPDAQEASQ